jgi:hypothetical protein
LEIFTFAATNAVRKHKCVTPYILNRELILAAAVSLIKVATRHRPPSRWDRRFRGKTNIRNLEEPCWLKRRLHRSGRVAEGEVDGKL